jgi:hypothetical protein
VYSSGYSNVLYGDSAQCKGIKIVSSIIIKLPYRQVDCSEQSLDDIFGLGYFIFLPFCGDLRILV